ESRPSVVNPSSTNNLREDISNQPATRGAVNEGVVDLTDLIAKDLKVPRQCGGFSDVWKGYLKDSPGKEVAIKCPRFTGGVNDEDKRKIKKRVAEEISTSSKLCHPNIIQLLGYAVVEDCEYHALVMDWCPGRTLHQQLKTSRLSLMEQSAMLLQLTAGIAYMHSNDIVHADLKPDNVLVGPQGQIKISDFGLSRIIRNIDPTSNRAHYGAETYMAPELGDDEVVAKTLFSDIWAFGIVAYQQGAASRSALKRMAAKAEGQPPYQDGQESNELTKHLMSLIAPCWVREPTSRPKMAHILTNLHEKYLKQDLSASRWHWLFAPASETCPRTSIIGGANSDDLLRLSNLKYEQGAFTESRALRAKAAMDKLFRGNLLECAKIQQELANSCVGQCDREATLHHYDSVVRKYESLGPAYAEATDVCRELRKSAVEGRQFGLWCDLSDPSAMIRRAGELGEKALDRNDFSTATRHFEELLDIARRDQKRDIMAQACVRLAWACELESRSKLSKAKEHYLEALEFYQG
ncbi:Serine/threonine-protein kinase plk1, partial [Ceratobasidium sp. 395]